MLAMDRARLTVDIMNVVADTKTNINSVNSYLQKENKMAHISLKMEIKSLDHLEYIMNKVRRVKDVLEVRRLTYAEESGRQ